MRKNQNENSERPLRSRTWPALVVASIVVLGITGNGVALGAGAHPPSGSLPLQSTSEASTSAQAGGDEATEVAHYVLQRGDEITVKVFNRPELEETVVIRPDGRVSLVLVDEIQAAQMTTQELDEVLTESYSRFYRDPQVTVIVRGFANQRVYVGGEVSQPGFVPLTGRVTALAAVLHAGGFKGTARKDSVILLRDMGDHRPTVRIVDLDEVINEGGEDVELMPFDVVYVPLSRIAKVGKFVDQYIRQVIPVTLTAGFTYLSGDSAVVVPAR